MTHDARNELAGRAADRLHSAAIHLLRYARREDDASGLGPARLSALSVVVYAGPVTLGELAAAEQVRPPTMTKIVYALEEAGLVTKRWDARRDRRSVQITATSLGRRVLEEARQRRLGALTGLLGDLTEDDLALLDRAAGLVEEALQRGREKADSPSSR